MKSLQILVVYTTEKLTTQKLMEVLIPEDWPRPFRTQDFLVSIDHKTGEIKDVIFKNYID